MTKKVREPEETLRYPAMVEAFAEVGDALDPLTDAEALRVLAATCMLRGQTEVGHALAAASVAAE